MRALLAAEVNPEHLELDSNLHGATGLETQQWDQRQLFCH